MTTINLTGYYGYDQYKPDLVDGTFIDASDATFTVDKDLGDDGKALSNPVSIRDADDITISGGTVLGQVDQTTDRETLYDTEPRNSTALYARNAEDVTFSYWRIDDVWDGIRTSYNTDGFVVEHVWITDTRDDAIENDKLNTGTYRDSLFDGVWAGISLDPSTGSDYDGAGKTVTIDGVLIRMKEYMNDGRMIHYTPLKVDKNIEMPDLRIIDSVFAIENVDHGGMERLALAWESVVESSGNYFLNLSDEPLPDDYPLPPNGWTILEGQEARDYWTKVRDEWVLEHAYMALPDDYVPSGAPEEPEPAPEEPEPAPEEPELSPEDPEPVSEDPEPEPEEPELAPEDPEPVSEDPEPEPEEPELAPEDPQPAPRDPAPVPDAGGEITFDGENFEGKKSDETIVGNDLDNYIDGNNGDDVIDGGAGNDIIRSDDGSDELWGGAGNDIFYYKRLSDSREKKGVDVIADFNPGEDKIDLSRIDANREMSGNQAFVLSDGAPGTGELSVKYDDTIGMTVIEGNVDDDPNCELKILLVGEHSLTADDLML